MGSSGLTDAQKAANLRKIADLHEQAALLMEATDSPHAASIVRSDAEMLRLHADKLDPPQPEWQEGDYVRDKNDGVWRYDGRRWCSAGGAVVSVSDLPEFYGSLTRLRVADPNKKEVVISLDGLDREVLRRAGNWSEESVSALTAVGVRAGRAMREQLKEKI